MYSKEEKIIMWLSSFDFMSYKKAMSLISNFDDLVDVFDNIAKYRTQLLKIFTEEEYSYLKNDANFVYIDMVIKNYDDLGITVVTYKSDGYPNLLKEISVPPIMLYCKGDISLLKTECLSVVGTRRATTYGKNAGSKIIKEVASHDITIVSGLAEGIDTVAHKATLEAKGKTIAVLGGGLLNIYPKSNIKLAEDIIENGGLLVSEYKPNEPPLTYHFPIRNRIIAGLSKAVFVVEATEKSGSMHTKNYALDYNREVFALPARVTDIYSVGCNKIIANGQARMLLDVSEIIDFFGKNINKNSEVRAIQLTSDEQIIYSTLDGMELHFDDIVQRTKLETKVLQTCLMRMEIKGILRKLPGNYYELIR